MRRIRRFGCVIVLLVAASLTSCGIRQRYSEDDVKADSAIVLREFPINASFLSVNATIVCQDGNVHAILVAEPLGRHEVLRSDLQVSPDTYLKLWRQLEGEDIWDLPSGEYWRDRELMESGGVFAARLGRHDAVGDYKQAPALHSDFNELEVRVGGRSHGFLRYASSELKDPRYYRAVEAVWEGIQVNQILTDWNARVDNR